MSKKKKNSRSLNTEEALILGNPHPRDDDDDHLFFNPSSPSSSLSSTDRFDPIKNYPSISSLEIDSKNHSHQPMMVREREMSKKKKNSRSLNTVEALILGNPPPPPPPPRPSPSLDDNDDDDDHLFFNPSSLSSSLSSTDRFDPIKNYPSISSLEIDSKNNHSHQPMMMEEEDRMEVKSSSCSIVKGRSSAIKERRRRTSSVKKKRKEKEMMCPSLHSAESTTLVPADEKRKTSFGTPQSKRLDCRDREFELMPPPGSHKKSVPATSDVDQPIDPNEPTYCVCHQVSFGDMIACDMDNCQGGERFHYSCVGLTPETRFKGKWYCPTCKLLPS